MRRDRPYQPDGMIQDVNPLNARIYFDDYMYVGGCKHIPGPLYFAPYFTIPCASNRQLTYVEEAGVSWISRVVMVRAILLRDLQTNPESAVNADIRSHKHWQRWQRGLQAIAKRARQEPFKQKYDPHRLYFLDKPAKLGRTIKKALRQSQLPHGFGRSYSDLFTIPDLGRRDPP